ncbi:MAG TPA: ABC transporter substrate-binding protein [Caulobacterales bacterium]|nr:ABC transporter substrate-binding protein [Caulobacterales bacterium]
MALPKWRLLRNFGLGIAAALVLTGGAAFAEETPLSVILGIKTPPLMNTLNLVAEGAGFYKEERLRVTTRLVDSPIEALRMCQRGEGDICPAAIEPLVDHYDDGIRMKMFLSRASKFGVVIAVLEDSPIKSLADLKGKSIGVHSAAGSAGTFTTQSALSAAGLKPADATMVTIGMDKEAMQAFTSRKVDAVGLPLYELVPFMVAGVKMRVFRHPLVGDVPNGGYAAAPSVMAAKADALGHFARAIVKASLLIRYNPKAAARYMLTAQGKPFADKDVARNAAQLTAWEDELPASDPGSRQIGAVPQNGVQKYIQLLADSGVTKRVVPASEVVTDRFIAFANGFDRSAFERRAESMH